MKNIHFRPHHFLCAFCFRGSGYSSTFIENFSKLMSKLNDVAGDDTVIEVVAETDSICSPCPHRRETLCTSQEKIVRLDTAHAQALNLKSGEKITWGEAKKRIRTQITPEIFDQICSPCEWKALDICATALGFKSCK